MPIPWNLQQRRGVEDVLTEHPAHSGRCELAAARILPIAREVDSQAVARRCDPLFGWFVHPNNRWFFHVTVSTAGHYVDALTGPDGLEEADYLRTQWAYPDAISWRTLADGELSA